VLGMTTTTPVRTITIRGLLTGVEVEPLSTVVRDEFRLRPGKAEYTVTLETGDTITFGGQHFERADIGSQITVDVHLWR
jgi:hypothetical protein